MSGRVGAVGRARRFGVYASYAEGIGSSAVPCPNCGHAVSKVVDSRPVPDGTYRRRRICGSCQFRYTTYESVSPFFITDFQI